MLKMVLEYIKQQDKIHYDKYLKYKKEHDDRWSDEIAKCEAYQDIIDYIEDEL